MYYLPYNDTCIYHLLLSKYIFLSIFYVSFELWLNVSNFIAFNEVLKYIHEFHMDTPTFYAIFHDDYHHPGGLIGMVAMNHNETVASIYLVISAEKLIWRD